MARATRRSRRSSGYYMRLSQTVVRGEARPRNELLKRLMQGMDRGNGWSIRQLAGAAGVSRAIVGHLVSGERVTCSRFVAERITQALGVDVYVLFEERDSRNSR